MAQDGTPNQPTIAAVMVSQGTGVTLTTKGGNSFTIDDEQDYVYDRPGTTSSPGSRPTGRPTWTSASSRTSSPRV